MPIIMLIEDKDSVQDRPCNHHTFVELLLEKCASEVLVVSSGREAVEKFISFQKDGVYHQPVDMVIFSDVPRSKPHEIAAQFIQQKLWSSSGEFKRPTLVKATKDLGEVEGISGVYMRDTLIEYLSCGDRRSTVLCDILRNNGHHFPDDPAIAPLACSNGVKSWFMRLRGKMPGCEFGGGSQG